MTEIIVEKVRIKDKSWIRTHATDEEGAAALCSPVLNPDESDVEFKEGKISCPDCISIIRKCKAIPDSDEQPEYENDMFWRK